MLSLAFAGVNALGNALGVLQALLVLRSSGSTPTTLTPEMMESYARVRELQDISSRVSLGQGLTMLVMDVALVGVGLLLLRERELGRRLAMLWSVAAWLVLVGRALVFEAAVMPVASRVLAGFTPSTGGAEQMLVVWTRVSSHGALAFMAIFPVTMFFVMRSALAKRALAGCQGAGLGVGQHARGEAAPEPQRGIVPS